jgi:hypothetical protein
MSKYRGVEPTNDVLREITDALMGQVKGLLGELRGEIPPEGFFVPASEPSSKTREAVKPSRSADESGAA